MTDVEGSASSVPGIIVSGRHEWDISLILSPLMRSPKAMPVVFSTVDVDDDTSNGQRTSVAEHFIDLYQPGHVVTIDAAVAGSERFGCTQTEAWPQDPSNLALRVGHHLGRIDTAVFFSPHQPSLGMAAASLASIPGVAFFPSSDTAYMAQVIDRFAPERVVAVGSAADLVQNRQHEAHVLGDAESIYRWALRQQPFSYIIVTNSRDQTKWSTDDIDASQVWVHKLSSAAPFLAAGRQGLVVDVDSYQPDPEAIERLLNHTVQELHIKPKYLAIVGSQASIPPVVKDVYLTRIRRLWTVPREIGIHLSAGRCLDVAVGRITGRGVDDGIALVMRSLFYGSLAGPWKDNAYVVSNGPGHPDSVLPFFECGARLHAHELRAAGYDVVENHFRDATVTNVTRHIPDAGVVFSANHGLSRAWLLADGRFSPTNVPLLKPSFVYTYSCSTGRQMGDMLSKDGGLTWNLKPLLPSEAISLAFIRRGAAAYIGGTSGEDHQHSAPMAKSVLNAMLYSDATVGEALLAAKNAQIVLDDLVRQVDESAARKKRWTFELAINQWTLFGDPAFRPHVPRPLTSDSVVAQPTSDSITVQVAYPKEWYRTNAVGQLEGGKKQNLTIRHPKCRTLEWTIPPGPEDVWGSYYPIAPNIDGIAATAIGSGMRWVTLPLPRGTMPIKAHLRDIAVKDAICASCGAPTSVDPQRVRKAVQEWRMPVFYTLDHGVLQGAPATWPLYVDGDKIHTMVPHAVFDDESKILVRLDRLTLSVELAPAGTLTGRITAPSDSPPGTLAVVALCDDREMGLGIVDTDGSFIISVPEGVYSLALKDVSATRVVSCGPSSQYHLEPAGPFTVRSGERSDLGALQMLSEPTVDVHGILYLQDMDLTRPSGAVIVVMDAATASPEEDYRGSLVQKVTTETNGLFKLSLPPGPYNLYATYFDGDQVWEAHINGKSVSSGDLLHIALDRWPR